jgi:hypothetical protein
VWQEDGDGITLRFEFLKSSLNSDVTNHVLNDNDLLLATGDFADSSHLILFFDCYLLN